MPGDSNGASDIFIHDRGGTAERYSISGRIVDVRNNPIEGVTVSTHTGQSAMTNASGNYAIHGLALGNYLVTPSLSPFSFSPPTRQLIVPPTVLGQDFTATPVTITDLGFRPNPDGYQFPNYVDVNDDDYTIEDMRRMFGDAAVCSWWGYPFRCTPKQAAVEWNRWVNQQMGNGHCDGFTTTSLRFFQGLDAQATFQLGANVTSDLLIGNVRRHIAYNWVLAATNPVGAARNDALRQSPVQVLNLVQTSLSRGAPDPVNLVFYIFTTGGWRGHSVTPYAIEDRGNGIFWIRVYDNNFPNNANRQMIINTVNNTWSYDMGTTTWSGNATTNTLGAIPLSVYVQKPVCPWCASSNTTSSTQATASQIWFSGVGHLLITDSHERRIGYVGDQFLNEIPGAFGSLPPTGLGTAAEPTYNLPLMETYTILVDGSTLTQTETVALSQFGPGYAVSVEELTIGPTSQDQLKIAADGTEIVYKSTSANEVDLSMILETESADLRLVIAGADVGVGQVVTLTTTLSTGQLVFNNRHGAAGDYTLAIERLDPDGQQSFIHHSLEIGASDTHYVAFGTWDGSGAMTLQIDHGSNGTIDRTVVLTNEAQRYIYLPIIQRP